MTYTTEKLRKNSIRWYYRFPCSNRKLAELTHYITWTIIVEKRPNSRCRRQLDVYCNIICVNMLKKRPGLRRESLLSWPITLHGRSLSRKRPNSRCSSQLYLDYNIICVNMLNNDLDFIQKACWADPLHYLDDHCREEGLTHDSAVSEMSTAISSAWIC